MTEPLAVFTDTEQASICHHMGYPRVSAISTYVLGVPAAMETTFMIQGAMIRVLQSGSAKVRECICRMDAIEAQVFCGSDLADVEEVGEIKVNRKRLLELAQYYLIAQQGLANLLGVVANPFDQRGWLMMGTGGINVSVTG